MLRFSKHSGFTIAETLVAIAIIAVLSAVIIPRMNAHIEGADAAAAARNLIAIRTGIKAFAGDVHRFPGKIQHLSDAIKQIQGGAKDINGQDYPANLETNWQGPYLMRDLTTNLGTVSLDPSIKPVSGDNGIDYATIQLNNVSPVDFENIEAILDAGTPTSTSSTAGVIRYSGTTLKFLAVPMLHTP